VFALHWQDESWHEVLRLIAGMIDAKFVAEMIDYLLAQQVDKSVFLQKETLLQRKQRGRKTALNSARRQKLKRQNEEWIEMSNLFLAVSCFAEVRNKQLISPTSIQLIRRMQYEIEKENSSSIGAEIVIKILSLLANIWQENSAILPYIQSHLNTNHSGIRRAVIQLISQEWQDDPDTLPMLRYYANNDKDLSIRSMSSTILIENFQERIDSLDILKYHENNDNLDAHFATMKDLIQPQKSKDRVFYFLYELAQDCDKETNQYPAIVKAVYEDENSSVEWWINKVFAPHWQDECWHETLLLISGLIDAEIVVKIINYLLAQQVDKSVYSQQETLLQRKTGERKNALNSARRQVLNRRNEEWIEMSNLFLAAKCFAAVRNKQIISSTSVQLMKRIQSEIEKSNSYSIGAEMANELIFLFSTIWQDNDETLPYLKKCLKMNSDTVRRAAIQSISQLWQDDPNILPLLKQYQYDDILDIQITAAKDLYQSHKDRSQIIDFLYNLVQDSDGKITPHQAVLQTIVENYPVSI
jgi:hypothetical protein